MDCRNIRNHILDVRWARVKNVCALIKKNHGVEQIISILPHYSAIQ